jgi:hypothetical protein
VRLTALILLAATAARADLNDVQLYLLGHPDPLGCTRCDGTDDGTAEAGSPLAQPRFHRFASTLGLALAPHFLETAGTLGQSGFEVGVSSSQSFLQIPNDAWPTQRTQAVGSPPKVLVVPTLTVRKGLGGSLELGAAVGWVTNSQIVALSGELRWALLDGMAYAPDVALRAWGTRALGTQDLDLTVGGADLQLSRSFGVAGMMKLQPYGQFGMAFVNAVSSVVNFKPSVENIRSPGLADGVFHSISFLKNRFYRGTVGLRLVAGTFVLAVEGSIAAGTNSTQDDNLAGNVAPPQNFVRVWGAAGRLGFFF